MSELQSHYSILRSW